MPQPTDLHFNGRKIRILEAVNQLGLGGTEYALQLYCKYLNREIFDVTVVSLLKGGERVQLIEAEGTKVIVLDGDLSRLPELLREADVLHWHGSGNCDGDAAFFEMVKANRPRLFIQTNVFGAYDRSPYYDLIDYDLYISEMILIRRMKQDKVLANTYARKRKVLPYPVDTDVLHNLEPTDEQVSEFKKQNQLENQFLVGRIGRADNNKFDLITLDGFAVFSRKNNKARFLLVGATPEMKAHADKLGIAEKLIIFENTADLRSLLLYYKVMNVFLAASNIGESFGMVIAEAMTMGTPVVTISTEDRDNAQIELVDNQKSGIVTRRNAKDIASALAHLYQNKKAAKQIAAASVSKIEQTYKAQYITRSLEGLILRALGNSVAGYTDNASAIKEFSSEMISNYNRRCTDIFGRPKLLKKLLWKLRKL